MFKNQLQEVAQRSCFNLPSYACIREGPDHAPRFKAIVNFNGETFESPTFCNTLRQAEHAAAEVALSTLSKRGPSRSLAARVLDETGVYKNLLQETAHRAGLNLPVYTTIRSGPGHTPVFTCTVELAGMSFMGDPAKTKKQAQKNAAMAAWSALKQLPNMGSSSSSSSLEAENNEEQEQVIIARALANRHSADGSKLVINDQQHEQLKQPPVQRGKTAARRAPLYSKPRYQSWAYSNLLPDVGTYQTWHQEQFVHQQSHLLTLPALPPNDPRNFPFVQSTQPMQGQYFSTIEQDPLTSIPFYQESTSSSSVGFTSDPLHTSRSRSQVSIQEIHEEKSDMEEKELFCNGSSDAEGNHRERKPDPLSSAASCSQLEGPNLHLSVDKPSDPEYSQKDKQASDSSHITEMPSEGEADVSNPGVTQVLINPHLSSVHSSTDGKHTQEIQQRGRNQMPPFKGMQAVPNTYDPMIQSYSNFTRQIHWAFGSTEPASVVHPPPAMISPLLPPHVIGTATGITIPVYGSGQRVDVFRPITPLVAAPVTVRTAIPVCSARRASPNLKSCVSHAMAPAVNIRTVAPVCSSPPPTHVPVQTRNLENQGASKTTLEFSKLHL